VPAEELWGRALLLATLLATAWMTGMATLVGRVHYPMFRVIDQQAFTKTMHDHQQRIFPLVGPPMAGQLLGSLGLCLVRPRELPLGWAILGVLLMAISGWVTVLWSVPCHQRLTAGFQHAELQSLLRSNHIRLAAWWLHLGLLLYGFVVILYPVEIR